MARIISVSGLDIIPETPLRISGLETEGEMDLKLQLQHAELEHGIAERVCGIGSPDASAVGRAVKDYRKAVKAVHNRVKRHRRAPAPAAPIPGNPAPNAAAAPAPAPTEAEADALEQAGEEVAGIGSLIGKKATAKKAAKQAKKAEKKAKTTAKKAEKKATKQAKKNGTKGPARAGRTERRAGFIKKAAAKIKKGTKAFAKVVTAPQRLLVKGIGEVFIPKMAMFFIYLFVTKPEAIAQLPAKVQRKRKKAEKFAKFMTGIIGMKEAHFLKLVRNGIMRSQKQTPEQLLSVYIKGSISGVGTIGIVTELIPIILEVIQKIAAAFGKKPAADETPTADDMPDLASDFQEVANTVKRKLLVHLKLKPESQKGREATTAQQEVREARQEESAAAQLDEEPDNTPVEAPLPEPEPDAGDEAPGVEPPAGEAGADVPDENFNPAGGGAGAPGPPDSAASSSLVPLALAAAAAAALAL